MSAGKRDGVGACQGQGAGGVKYLGRRKPYTVIGISRKKCIRCEAPAVFQWNACANGNWWMPLCLGCDVALNDMALKFIGHPHRIELMAAYRHRVSTKE